MKPYYEHKGITIYHGDCLEIMPELEPVNLICMDPPYNIKKAKWDKIKNYIEWMGIVFTECQRVLKCNGSFYFFHNDFLQIVELQSWLNKNSNFVFKQLIVWNKRFDVAKNKGFLDGFVETNQLRNYQKMVEYCLFYTFSDGTGLEKVMLDVNNFFSLRGYFKELQEFIGLNIKQINAQLGHRRAEHCFYWKTTQWELPTRETYQELIDVFNIDKWKSFRKYESLRQEYESLRYTFNNQKTHHSVWNYEIADKLGHVTPKPEALIENIVKHSSNENNVVLDCFMGRGVTGVACKNLNRNFIGIEREEKDCEIAARRLQQEVLFGK